MLTHHKLKVYEKALVLGADAQELSASWGKQHAIVEHYRRAAESVGLNLAEGARLRSGADKARTLDYAMGSTLEYAACLDVYRVGLDLMGWFAGLPGAEALANRGCREVDKAATSVVLNVAEGNGRYCERDHRRFLEIAAHSAVKATAYLDFYERTALPAQVATAHGRELMSRIVAMVSGF